jgi:hypothetical protein
MRARIVPILVLQFIAVGFCEIDDFELVLLDPAIAVVEEEIGRFYIPVDDPRVMQTENRSNNLLCNAQFVGKLNGVSHVVDVLLERLVKLFHQNVVNCLTLLVVVFQQVVFVLDFLHNF